MVASQLNFSLGIEIAELLRMAISSGEICSRTQEKEPPLISRIRKFSERALLFGPLVQSDGYIRRFGRQ
jgi:hypothetical protein